MGMASLNYEKAQELWSSFYNVVMFHHRYLISHSMLDKLKEIAKECEKKIYPGDIYYRARIIDSKAAQEHMAAKCYGVNRDGRSNLRFIRYLYVSESPTTAVFEVRPLLFNSVNVAGIEVKEELNIADIAVDIDMDPRKEKTQDEWLLSFVQSAFSSPTYNTDDYIPTQIIAEFFRHLGYDGIRYSSSLHRGGYNLTVFDTSKCEPVFSTDLRLEDIKISLRPAIGAENIDGRFEYIIDNVPIKIDYETGKFVEVRK